MNARVVALFFGGAFALTACTRSCGGPRTELVALGSIAHRASPTPCRIDGDAIAPKDGDWSRTGKGIDYVAVKVGKALIHCDTASASLAIEVREPVRIDFGNEIQKGKAGGYVPSPCIHAYDRSGSELDVGRLTEGVAFDWSDKDIARAIDHGMGWIGPAPTTCLPNMLSKGPEALLVTASWRGLTASTTIQIEP